MSTDKKYTQEDLDKMKDTVYVVFRAEDTIKGDWVEKLNETKDADSKTKNRIADEYVTAIATEILEHLVIY
jgi:hypothetical protein